MIGFSRRGMNGLSFNPIAQEHGCQTVLASGTLNAKMTTEYTVKLNDKYWGREVTAELPEQKGLLRVRFYLVNERMYQVMVVGTPNWANSPAAAKFLESLKISD
jgi:hypothetical protein